MMVGITNRMRLSTLGPLLPGRGAGSVPSGKVTVMLSVATPSHRQHVRRPVATEADAGVVGVDRVRRRDNRADAQPAEHAALLPDELARREVAEPLGHVVELDV